MCSRGGDWERLRPTEGGEQGISWGPEGFSRIDSLFRARKSLPNFTISQTTLTIEPLRGSRDAQSRSGDKYHKKI